jgi:lipopolysaccharide/colanic/teichoic acid biosynthesis glycosyltransferase
MVSFPLPVENSFEHVYNPQPGISISPSRDRRSVRNQRVKRGFDVIAAVSLIALLGPVLLSIAAAIAATCSGPVLFRQQRAGAGGRLFWLYKFRTMRHTPGAPFQQATQDDPRVTRLGKILRATSLDELPQLINVLRGDMSLVGPRPHAPETAIGALRFADAHSQYAARERVRPGITGLAQIRGHRGPTPTIDCLERRLAADLEYIERQSLTLDMAILVQSVGVIFRK